MQYFAWEGMLCRLWRTPDGALHAEGWETETQDYAPASAAEILREGTVLGKESAMAWLRHIRHG